MKEQEIEEIVLHLCQSIKPDGNLVAEESSSSLENGCRNDDMYTSLIEQDSWNDSDADQCKDDRTVCDDVEKSNEEESSICWENVTKKINENVEKKGT